MYGGYRDAKRTQRASRQPRVLVLQDAILRLSGVVTYEQLEEALKDALELALPNVSEAVVYVLSPGGHELVSSHGLLHTLPKEGLAGECVQRRERLVVAGVEPADPLAGLLHAPDGRVGTTNNKRKVVCCPIQDKENDRVVGVFVVVCDELTKDDHEHLSFLEKQLLVCYRRLKHTAQLISPPTCNNDKIHNNNTAILNLCADLYDQDAASLQIKVIHYLVKHTDCESGFLLLVDAAHREIFCQALGGKILEEEIRFPYHENSFSTVVKTKRPIRHEDIEQSHKEELEKVIGEQVSSLLCVPVCSRVSGEVVAMACLLNKHNTSSFSQADEDIVTHCFKYTATVLHSTLAVQNERKLKNQTQAMLQVAQNLFTHLDDLTMLLREIMQEARNLTKAERCSVFLLEKDSKELVAKVFDGELRNGKEVLQMHTEVRIPSTQGIAGHVATTGKLLNIDDAYDHPLFYRGVDETTGFRTRNILCFPIKNENGEVIGVAQLCNKQPVGSCFSSFDEDIAQAFSVFCCMSIVHSLMYKEVRDSQHRSQLSSELMVHHMQVSNEEVDNMASMVVPSPLHFSSEMCNWNFIPRSIVYDETPLAVHSMFEDMGFISKYRMKRETLAKFSLMVRKGYRDPPYHNWSHAFAVGHFCYLEHKNLDLLKYLDDLELLALFVACLCHDIDHRGTTNSFQVASGSTLAALYSSEGSVMERHHFAQTACILNSPQCNIFENLEKHEYELVMEMMREIILATDLAHHLKILRDLKIMANEGYQRTNPRHRRLLLFLLMTSCDLSDQTKHWKNSKKIAELIYQEFFSQGDLEKATGQNPMEMMDRDRACIPELQVGFLDGIALPVFRLLAQIFPRASEVQGAVESNKDMWVKVNSKMREQNLPTNMDLFTLQMDDLEKNCADEVASSSNC